MSFQRNQVFDISFWTQLIFEITTSPKVCRLGCGRARGYGNTNQLSFVLVYRIRCSSRGKIYKSTKIINLATAAVSQWVRTFAPQAEGWVFESKPRQTYVVKTGSDSSTSKRSAIDVSVMGPRRWPLQTDAMYHSRCGMLKNPNCSMTISAEHMSKFAGLQRQWWRLFKVINTPVVRKPQRNINLGS